MLIQLNCSREIYWEHSRTLNSTCPACCDQNFQKPCEPFRRHLKPYIISTTFTNHARRALVLSLIGHMQIIGIEFSQNNLESSWFNLPIFTINCRVKHSKKEQNILRLEMLHYTWDKANLDQLFPSLFSIVPRLNTNNLRIVYSRDLHVALRYPLLS